MAARTLLITKGHPFEKGPFFDWIDACAGLEVTHIEHPAAEAFIGAGLGADYDLWLFYDMPGYDFDSGVAVMRAPSDAFKAAVLERMSAGKPCLFLHHAIAGWGAWDAYGDIIGGRFLYAPRDVRGRACLDSGYRHDVAYQVTLSDHAICKGIASFEVTDELYLCQVFEDEIVPLAWSSHGFVAENFYSAAQAVGGKMFSNDGWDHPPGSNIVAWVKSYDAAPIGYLQMGDGPSAYSNEGVTALLANMAQWLLSHEAATWAAQRKKEV